MTSQMSKFFGSFFLGDFWKSPQALLDAFEKASNNLFEIITQTPKTLKRFAVYSSFRREYDGQMSINFCEFI